MTETVRHHSSFRLAVSDAPAIAWRATPEDREAHAFRDSGPGWMRSACRREHFSFRHERVDDLRPRCLDCQLLTDGAPGEITEAYGR